MELIFVFGFVAIGLAILNSVLLLVRIITKRVKLYVGLLIVLTAIFLPYVLALVAASFGNGWDSLDKALHTWIISGLLLMILVLIYLVTLKKE